MSFPRRSMATVTPYLALFGAILVLVCGTSFAKQLFPLVGAEGTSALRVGFSALLLLIVWRPWRAALGRADLLILARYGAVLGVMNLCFYMSLRTIPLGIAIAIEFAGPLGVALWHARRLSHLLWIAMVAAGLALLLPLRADMAALDPAGLAFASAAGLCWALYIIFAQRASHLHPGHSVALGMTVAALVILPFGIASGGARLLDPHIMLMGLGVAILSSALPYSLEMVALRALPKRTFGVLVAVEPAAGAVAGLIFLGERLTMLQSAAIGLIIVAGIGTVLTTSDGELVGTDPP